MALGVDDVKVGTWTHPQGHTGCTVILPPEGTVGGVAVRGGGPGTREAAALGPTGQVQTCHAVVLSGGSAFGLATGDGAMRWCEEQGIGHQAGNLRVPIVGGAIVFDLAEGMPRPDADAGYAACAAATTQEPVEGLVGVGAGCTAGKLAGPQFGVPGGQGVGVARHGELTVGALLAVNALGDVLDERGEMLAGSSAPEGTPRYPFVVPQDAVAESEPHGAPREGTNTVIGCLVTNGTLSKTEACRAADLSHTGIARAVQPPHTSHDGDALFALATGQVPATLDQVAFLGAQAVGAAIRSAVRATGA